MNSERFRKAISGLNNIRSLPNAPYTLLDDVIELLLSLESEARSETKMEIPLVVLDQIVRQQEEIDRLEAENKELKIEKYRLVVPLYMQGMLERGEISQKHLDEWFEQALKRG